MFTVGIMLLITGTIVGITRLIPRSRNTTMRVALCRPGGWDGPGSGHYAGHIQIRFDYRMRPPPGP